MVVCTHFKVNGINIYQGTKFELWCHKLDPSCTPYSIGIHVWFITQILLPKLSSLPLPLVKCSENMLQTLHKYFVDLPK
jgi:hypothetical protein